MAYSRTETTGCQTNAMTTTPTLTALRYGLLLAETACYHCQAITPTAAIWVGDYQEHDEEGELVDQDAAALLKYAVWLDEGATALFATHAPWVKLAPTQTAGLTYWANHCRVCGSVQGDHFVQGVDGPYWPEDEKAWVSLSYEPGIGPIRAVAEASRSVWMEQVESRRLKRP